MTRDHIDLFAGIGGFSLAARAAGIRTVCQVEIDPRCREFLRANWPGVQQHDDIKTFHWTSRHFLVTAGVPCQPASRAGKQRGAADVRWLWPEVVRVIHECHPAWAVLENPPGIGDVGLAGILSQVEGEGYEVRVFSIPACAVGAPHRRERYWIVAHLRQEHGQRGPSKQDSRQKNSRERNQAASESERTGQWSRCVWLPCADGKLRRAPDDSFGMVDGLPVELSEGLAEGETPAAPHRSLLAALGNSIVWPLSAEILKAIVQANDPPTTHPMKRKIATIDLSAFGGPCCRTNDYTIEPHGENQWAIYQGRCNHRHGYNLGNVKEPDMPRLLEMLKYANRP